MALLAEEVVEEWLNRAGYFTIRGLMVGVHQLDLLAIKPHVGEFERRHIEVQASIRPVSYITPVTKAVRRTGRAANSAKKRSPDELRASVNEWVKKKFHLEIKRQLREQLCPGEWSLELVVHNVMDQQEVTLIKEEGIKVLQLADIVKDLAPNQRAVEASLGADLVDLIALSTMASDAVRGAKQR